jgi:hypothetical protein
MDSATARVGVSGAFERKDWSPLPTPPELRCGDEVRDALRLDAANAWVVTRNASDGPQIVRMSARTCSLGRPEGDHAGSTGRCCARFPPAA